jgi:crotonobetainyl-CoA:carnitine CoA-transferase CaiB-like acyl-CoA transferase
VAAPFCTRLLADLGADVIKIEPPGGDPVRQWGQQVEGAGAHWWSMHARNKRVITLNLKKRRAVEIVLDLVRGADALGTVLHAGIVPHVPDEPRAVRWIGQKLGQHTDQILRELRLPAEEIASLRSKGVAP